MDIKNINLKLESNGNKIEVGKGKSYRLLNIDGIESADGELFITKNAMGDGSNINNTRIKDRPIMAEIEYVGINKEKERSKLINFFNIHKIGIFTINYGGKEYKIKYAPKSLKIKNQNIYLPLIFMVDLYCPNPFFTNTFDTKTEIAVWQPAFEFPLEIPEEGIEMGYREPSLIVNVFNKGHVPCGIRIDFKALATVVSPSLFNVNTREEFKINKTMEAGEVITVTTHFQNKKVELNKNGVTSNAFNWIDFESTFLQLYVGDNLFRYDADEGLDNLEVSIYHNPQYLGV